MFVVLLWYSLGGSGYYVFWCPKIRKQVCHFSVLFPRLEDVAFDDRGFPHFIVGEKHKEPGSYVSVSPLLRLSQTRLSTLKAAYLLCCSLGYWMAVFSGTFFSDMRSAEQRHSGAHSSWTDDEAVYRNRQGMPVRFTGQDSQRDRATKRVKEAKRISSE